MIHPRHTGLTGLALTLVALAGCSTGQSVSPTTKTDTRYIAGFEDLDTESRLEMLAEREAVNPSESDRGFANRIMKGRLLELPAGTAEFERAHRSVDDVLEDVLDHTKAAQNDEIPLLASIAKGYVRARAAMLNDEIEQAVELFEQLNSASPESAEILIGLGDAHNLAGNRLQASQAYLRAVELGDRTVRALVYGAMGSTDDPDRVIELGATIWALEDSHDRAGRLLGGVMLGQALIESGHFAAGAEIMSEAMKLLDAQTVRDPRYRRELVQLYTKRAEQHASLGDAWMLLNRSDRAMEQYDLAGSMVSSTPLELVSRRVAAYLMSGHSAQGALTLLGWVDANPGNDSGDFAELLETLRDHPLIGELVFDSLVDRTQDQKNLISQRRALLGMTLGLAESPERSVSLLSEADPEIISPVGCARVLSRFDSRGAKINAVMRVLESSPTIGAVAVPALIRLDGHPIEMLAAIEGDSESAQMMRCLIVLNLQRPDLLESLGAMDADSLPLDTLSTSWLIAHGRAAAMGGRWAFADRLLEQCALRESSMDAAERFFYVNSLVTANQFASALEIIEQRVAEPSASASDWLEYARIIQVAGDQEKVLEALERAIDLDPYDETIYEQLISMRGPSGAFEDVEELRTITRSLTQRLPGSALVKLIRTHEMIAGGEAMITPGERMLVNIHSQHPWREIGTDLLLSIWATQSSAGDANAMRRGLGWIDSQLEIMPGSVALIGAKARLMVLGGDSLGAEFYLDEMNERIPTRSLGRLHEGLIRSDEQRRDEADQLALSRLEGLVSVSDCLERLERAAGSGRINEYEPDLLVPIDGSWKLGMGQTLRVVRVLGALAQVGDEVAGTELMLELVERTRQQSTGEFAEGGIDPLASLNLIEIVVRPNGSGFSMDRYEQLLRDQSVDPDAGDLITAALQALLKWRTPSDALDLIARLSITNDGLIDNELVSTLSSLLGQIGSAGDIERSVERLESAGLLVDARDSTVASLGTLREGTMADAGDRDGVLADLVYSIAVVASFYERDTESTAMYRLALSHDPDHAWANNDLGYHIVEDGGDLDEAERLLTIAHQAEPDAASITDSLAWARYAMGIMENELDEAGGVVRKGARELLQEALLLDDGPENATIHDHLGDALWMLGEFDRALSAWLDAETQLRSRLTELSNQTIANPTALESIRTELSTIRFKISDGESGRVPKVAPTSVGLSVPDPSEDPGDIVNEIDPIK